MGRAEGDILVGILGDDGRRWRVVGEGDGCTGINVGLCLMELTFSDLKIVRRCSMKFCRSDVR